MTRTWKRARVLIGVGAAAVMWFVLLTFGSFGFWLLYKAVGWMWAALAVLVTGYVGGFLDAVSEALARRIRHKPRGDFGRVWLVRLLANSFGLGLIAALAFFGARYINLNHPFLVPRVTLTNGDKEVVFQGMLHIGSGSFYEHVVYDMLRAEEDGYDFFFEGYSDGTPENNERFQAVQGRANDVDTYEMQTTLADVCDLTYQQDYFRMWQVKARAAPERYAFVDVSVDEMMNEWDRVVHQDAQLEQSQQEYYANSGAYDFKWSRFFAWYGTLNADQRELMALACQSLLNVAAGVEIGDMPPFDEKIIMDFRNRVLANKILEHPHTHIFVTYGAGHLQGVYD